MTGVTVWGAAGVAMGAVSGGAAVRGRGGGIVTEPLMRGTTACSAAAAVAGSSGSVDGAGADRRSVAEELDGGDGARSAELASLARRQADASVASSTMAESTGSLPRIADLTGLACNACTGSLMGTWHEDELRNCHRCPWAGTPAARRRRTYR